MQYDFKGDVIFQTPQQMPQTLHSTFYPYPHSPARRPLSLRSPANAIHSLESLMIAMQSFLANAKTDLLQPRPQAVNRILLEAAALH